MLHGKRHLAHLVQKDGAAARGLKQPRLIGSGAGEGAPLVSKEFVGDKLRREGPAVEGDKGATGPMAALVEGTGDQFLAGAALTQDEDVAVHGRDAADGGKDRLHGWGTADHAVEPALGRQVRNGGGRHEAVDCLCDYRQEFGDLEGLFQVVEGPLLSGLDRLADRGVAGNEDYRCPRAEFLEPLHQVDAIGIRQVDVQQGQIRLNLLGLGHELGA